MTAFVSKMLLQTDKIPILHHASAWLPGNSNNEKPSEEYECPPTIPRYSISPPSYENVVQEKLENSRFGNTLSTIWKRASFSSAYIQEERPTPECSKEMLIDKKQIDHAATLINVATDMNNSGHQQMAIDLYIMGLDKLIDALPLEASPTVKSSLERKLIEIQERHQLNLSTQQQLEEKADDPAQTQMAHLVVQAAILGAIALKKSPIPDAVTNVVNFAAVSVQSMDQKHQIRKRTWDFIASGVTKAIEVDRQYEIHQMVTGAVRTGLTAFVKAGMAYAETPGPGGESQLKGKRGSVF
ncbi:hypothetical protein BD560DRAFT_372812 [Blakeslea trispora]|nr:hypothetical protein BD560DRAFT_372812 [Blakeslea trispora]